MSGERVTLSMDEAMAVVAAPGQTFEVVDVERDGVTNREFKNSPRTCASSSTRLGASTRPSSSTRTRNGPLTPSCVKWTLWLRPGAPLRIRPGDRVGIAMRNLPEWIVSFAAIISVGAVSVSLNAWWTEDELDYAINDSGAKVLIADTERVARAEAPCQSTGVSILGVRLDELLPSRRALSTGMTWS